MNNNAQKSIRRLEGIEKVVYDKQFAQENGEKILYEVYRNKRRDGNLRYDITILKPNLLGGEYARTKGNVNKDGYQELYTVLEGEAIFLLQRFEGKRIDDIYAVKVKPGEWVIIPPYYWVIMINPSEENNLETANWVSNQTENIYQPLEEMKGMGYFYTTEGWIKNKNYDKVPELRFENSLKNEPESLDFLRGGIER